MIIGCELKVYGFVKLKMIIFYIKALQVLTQVDKGCFAFFSLHGNKRAEMAVSHKSSLDYEPDNKV